MPTFRRQPRARRGVAIASAVSVILGGTVGVGPLKDQLGVNVASAQTLSQDGTELNVNATDDPWRIYVEGAPNSASVSKPVTLTGFSYTLNTGKSKQSGQFPDNSEVFNLAIYKGPTRVRTIDNVTASTSNVQGPRLRTDTNTWETDADFQFKDSSGNPATISLEEGQRLEIAATSGKDWLSISPKHPGDATVKNWTAPDPLQKDPLFTAEDKDLCIVPVEGGTERVGTTTWIAESFYAPNDQTAATGSGPRDLRRNYTILQYRDEATQTFQPVNGGNYTPWVYNALAYNAEDGYLYAVSQDRPAVPGQASGNNQNQDDARYPAGHLLRVSPVDGSVQDLGEITGLDAATSPDDIASGFTNGTFDIDGKYIFSNNSLNGSGYVYTISFANGSPNLQATRSAEAHKQLSANDWAHYDFEGASEYLWSINSQGGRRKIYRTNTATGAVDQWDVTNLATPAGDKLEDGVYGNAWTYNNGNLGFSVNNKGIAYQIAVDGFDTDTPRFALVSAERVPTSYNNDATSNARLVAKPEFKKSAVDLSVDKQLELDQESGKAFWTITVKNESPDCASSGFTLRDVISKDTLTVNDVAPMSAGWLDRRRGDNGFNWTHGPLGPGEEAKLRIDSDLVEGQKCAVNKVSVIGNERDDNEANNTDLAGDCVSKLTIKKYIKEAEDGDDLQASPDDILAKYKDAQDNEAAVTVDKTKPLRIAYVVTNEGGTPVSNISISDVASGHNADAFNDKINESIQTEISKRYPDGFNLEPEEKGAVVVTADALNADAAFHRDSATARGEYDPKDFTNYPKFNGGIDENGSYDPFENLPNPSGTRTVVSNEDEANAETPLQILIEKRINGRKEAVVKSGEDMEIWYRVTNPNAIALHSISLVDEITEGSVDQQDLADKLKEAVGNEGKFDLEPGESKEFSVKVTATNDVHENVVRPTLPPTTVDGPLVPVTTQFTTTEHVVPGTTVPPTEQPPVTAEDTTYPATTIPGVTIPETTVVQRIPTTTSSSPRPQTVEITSTPSATATATPVRLDIVKDIIGKDGATYAGDAPATTTPEGVTGDTTAPAPVEPGKDMVIVYTVTNNGKIDLTDVSIADEVLSVEGDQDDKRKSALQDEINKALEAAGVIPTLKAGESKPVTVTVTAPEGAHVNEAKATAPGVPQPETVIPGTTITPVPGSPVTIPPTTVPATVVTPNTPSNQARSTPTTSVNPPAPVTSQAPEPKLSVKKFINGRDEHALVTAGEDMEITYRVTNEGAVRIEGIGLTDKVKEDNAELQNAITDQLRDVKISLDPGQSEDVKVKVKAPAGRHDDTVNVTVPPVTVPATTIPGTTNSTTTMPETVVPSTVVTVTAPPDDAASDSVNLEILKDIFSLADEKWHAADKAEDAAVVDANGKMRVRYTVTNTGSVALSGVDIVDNVTRLDEGDKQALTGALNDALKAEGRGFDLKPDEKKVVEITVNAPKGYHVNEASATAPAVTTTETFERTLPPTTDETTTRTAPVVTTVTESVEVTPPTPTNIAQATPTTSDVPAPVEPQFAVEKLGNQSGISLERNEDGRYAYSASYTVRVRNTGTVAGTHAKVQDVPVRGVGFDISSVNVDGAEVAPNSGTYLISDGAELGVGEYKDYQVVVAGTLSDESANALPAAVGQCDAVTPQNPGAGSGLVNTVQMAGDSDGPDNNIVCEPVELRRLNVEKRIDGRDSAPVTPGKDMEIWYRVRNTGNVTLSGITLADQITEDNEELQNQINAEIEKIGAFDLAPGEFNDVKFMVKAPEGEHTNEVKAQVPGTTVPGTTVPETTVPGTANETTTVPPSTIPGTTVPERPVPGTTVTATAHANSPKLEIKKYINGYDEGTQVAPGEDMEILYRVANTGSVRIDGIRLDDEVTEAADEQVSKALQRDIDAALKKEAPFALEPGEVREVRITVPAPAGGHVNVAKPIVPPVTVPGTTIPGTTNPNTTVPGTTVPSTVVTVTTPSDDARSDSPALDIKKYINNIDDGDIVTPGDDMVITYRVFNNGNADAKGVTIADEVTEGSKATKADLTKQIEAELAKVDPFDIPAGEFRDVEITVKAPAGGHVNVAKPNVPPVTVPATTIPGTTNPRTTIPETTVPERVVTQTTTPSDDARSDSLKLEILKDIFSLEDNEWHAADSEDDAAVVDANGKMRVRYTVTNTGSVTLGGIDIIDNVTRLDEGDQQALTDALNGALEAEGRGFTLKPGEKKIVEITVDAPKGYHVNEAIATAPAVPTTQTQVSSVPGTTDATTTVPGSLTTTVVTTEKTPNVPTNTAQATPTTSATTPVPPPVTTTVAPEQPQFAVEKLGARAGNVALTRNEEGSYDYSNEYVIRVRNSGLVDGEHATIWDVPLRGAGFTVNEVTVDEKAVDVKNGRYKVADAAELKPGKYKDYKVTVTGTLAEAAANNLPEAVGQCTAEGANPGADSGLVNVVNMDGDTDGPGNNVVCTPVELRRLNIEKRINGREDASVTPGQKMEIWYRVRNTGNVELTDIAVADQIREDNQELQDEINAELAKKAEPFNLAPGAFQDIRIEVTAPKGEHVNEARAEVPETTVPESTRPGTTIPGTTGPSTTVPPVIIPGTTLPGRPVPGTTVSTTARANSPLLEVKKFINGRDEHALVNAGEDMDITYRVTNKGTLPIDGIRLTDEVKEDNAELQQAIDAQLGKVAPFALEPGESMDVTVTVKAPAGRHDNEVSVEVPPVTIPATTIPGTTNPHTTVPGTTVPSTVVTVTAPPDDASSDSPQLEILKEIRAAGEGDDAWRDAETEGDALPIGEGEPMELRYTVTNTGSVKLDGVDIVDNVTRLDGGDADEFTVEINKALESAGRGLSLEPGESVEIVIEVSAPAGYHVNEAIATAPPVTATETVVSSVPGTTNETTTVPGSFVTETTVVERTPNTPTNKAQSTPTTGAKPCDCEVKTTTIIPAPVTTTVSGEVTTVTPDPVTSEITVTQTPDPVTSEVTVTDTPDPVTSEVTVTETPEQIVTTVVKTHEPITVTRTTPVTTVHTVTPEPQTLVTTVEGPTVTQTPEPPARVVVIVDEGGEALTTVAPTPNDGAPRETETVTYTVPTVTLPQSTVTEVPTTLVTTTQPLDEGNDILGRCIANAVRSPILYMVPLLLAGQVLGEVAAPYVKAVNDQFNQISAEIQEEIRRKTPNFGYGRRGQENEQVAELRAKAEAANRMLQELAMRPDVQQYGQWAAIAAGVVVAGSVLYDWCSNEAGEAFTAIGPKKSTSIDEVRVGGSSLGGDRVTTVVPPVTNTPGRDETAEDAGEAAGEAGSDAGSADGSSAGSSEGSSN